MTLRELRSFETRTASQLRCATAKRNRISVIRDPERCSAPETTVGVEKPKQPMRPDCWPLRCIQWESSPTSTGLHQNPVCLKSRAGKEGCSQSKPLHSFRSSRAGASKYVLNEIEFTQITLSCPVLVMVVLPVKSPKVWIYWRPAS
jgi:hypothetical protein